MVTWYRREIKNICYIRFLVIDRNVIGFFGVFKCFLGFFQHKYLECKATQCKEKNIDNYSIAQRIYVLNHGSRSIAVPEIWLTKDARKYDLCNHFAKYNLKVRRFSKFDNSININSIFDFSTDSDFGDYGESADMRRSSK